MTTRFNHGARREARRESAKERQEHWDKLSLEQRISSLDSRLGDGQGATRQRARLAKQIEKRNAKPEPKPKTEQSKGKQKRQKRKDKK